jgi:hypothetical protein
MASLIGLFQLTTPTIETIAVIGVLLLLARWKWKQPKTLNPA